MTTSTTNSQPLAEDERAELERLRAEVADLKAHPLPAAVEPAGRDAGRTAGRGRTALAVVLVVLGCMLAPLAVVAVWTNNQVSNTDRWVENVAPVGADPDVQAAITNRITNVVFTYVDVEGLVQQGVDALAATDLAEGRLPPQVADALRGLSGSIADGVRGFVHDQVADVVRSEEFEQAWVQANRVAHREMVQVLSGEDGDTIKVSGGNVSVDLAAFIDVVKDRLSARGFGIVDRIPEVHPTFVIAQSKDLVRMQTAYRWLDRLALVLPILSLGLILLGVYVARRHRRMLVGGAIGLAVSMLVLAAGLAVARILYLDALPESSSASAATVVYDTLVRFLRLGLRVVLVTALVVALAAFVTGSSSTAIRTRTALSKGIARLRTGGESVGLRTGPVGSWVFSNRMVLRIGAVVLTGVAFVFWDRPTGKVVLLLTAILVVVLAVIEFLGRPPAESVEEPPPAPS